MSDEAQILLEYFKVRRILNLISGVCFLVYVIVFPGLYFSLSSARPNEDYSYILYAPLMVCLLIQICCASMILHYRRKAMHQIAANAVNYTQVIGHAPPGMAIPYQHQYHNAAGEPQAVFVLPPDAVQQFLRSNPNIASFPSQDMNPPTYSQVVTNEQQPRAQPSAAGWAVAPNAGSNSSLSQGTSHATSSRHSRNDSL